MSQAAYPVNPETLPVDAQLSSGHYIAEFARSEEELREVQKLRFEVFNLEMGEGLDDSFETGLDRDSYDSHCHHLMVRDQSTGEVVGTYRMQNQRMASQGRGFYSDNEYELEKLPAEVLDRSLELGRACISTAHRNGRVLFLLWRGLLYYLQHNQLRYMFGCCSVTTQNPVQGWSLYIRLKRTGSLHPGIHLPARKPYLCPHVDPMEEDIAGSEMPRLMRLYLDYGAKICSTPAIDREFKTIDFLALFDLADIPPKLMKIFRKDLEC